MKKLNVLFVLKQPYPNGMACTKRVHLYAKGLAELGNKVFIVIPRSTESGVAKNNEIFGVFEGINYRYTSTTTLRPNSFLKRRISDLLSPLRAAILVLKSKPDIIFLVSPFLYHLLLFKIVSLISSAKLVKEKNEVPFMYNDSINGIQKYYLRIVNSMLDGVVIITNELNNYYKNTIKSNTVSCIIPILVDFKNNAPSKTPGLRSNKLVYTGAMLQRKDGILTIIEAFKYALQKFPDLELQITGEVEKSNDYKVVHSKIIELNLENKVVFTGFLSEKELNELLSRADILLLAKPLNRQNKYNFPTKVGEYLSSGTPIVISDVGETVNYLQDMHSAFISKPNAIDFAFKIEYILRNYNQAIEVAQNGFFLAKKEFCYKNCTQKLNEFLVGL
jgi:glycosyltransferase involved in cell wall biosynthesis